MPKGGEYLILSCGVVDQEEARTVTSTVLSVASGWESLASKAGCRSWRLKVNPEPWVREEEERYCRYRRN